MRQCAACAPAPQRASQPQAKPSRTRRAAAPALRPGPTEPDRRPRTREVGRMAGRTLALDTDQSVGRSGMLATWASETARPSPGSEPGAPDGLRFAFYEPGVHRGPSGSGDSAPARPPAALAPPADRAGVGTGRTRRVRAYTRTPATGLHRCRTTERRDDCGRRPRPRRQPPPHVRPITTQPTAGRATFLNRQRGADGRPRARSTGASRGNPVHRD